jgi:O-antigen/teichoic acid export membrane protein
MADTLERVAEESARGGVFLVAGGLLGTVISSVAAIFIGRFLGPELYGQYALALALPTMLFFFADFGITQGMIRFVANLRQQGELGNAGRIIKYGMLVRVIAGVVIFLASFVFAEVLAVTFLGRPDFVFYLQVASLSIFFQVIFSCVSSAYVGLDRAEYSALVTNVQATSKSAISIVLVIIGLGITGAIIGHVAGFALGGLVGVLLLFIILRRSDRASAAETLNVTGVIKTLIRFGLPLYVSTLLVGFIPPFQNLVLGLFTANVALGNYKAAFNFVTLITVVSLPMTTALLPAFAKLHPSSTAQVASLFRFANKYTTLVMVPFVTVIMALSNEIVYLVYGSTYQTAGLFLSVYGILYLLVGLGLLNLPSLFNGIGQPRVTLTMSLIALAILLPLSPVLARLYGVFGALTALILANVASTVYGGAVAKKRFAIQYDTAGLLKIYGVAAVAAIPSLLLQVSAQSSVVVVAVGAVAYLAIFLTVIPLVGVVSRSELEKLYRVADRVQPLGPLARLVLRYEEWMLRLRA